MKIAGIVVPAINGYFYPYLPNEGESRRAWRSRLFRLRKGLRYGESLMKIQARLDLPLFEQIRRAAQTVNALKNRYSKLSSEVLLESNVSYIVAKPTRREVKPRFFGPRTNFGFNYIESRLALKLKRALAQAERLSVEARRRRRAVMKMVTVRDGHKVSGLTPALQKLMAHVRTQLVERRSQSYSLRYLSKECSAQMDVEDASPSGDASATTQQGSNIVVQLQTDESTGSSLPGGATHSSYAELSAASSTVVSETFHDRPITIYSGEWKASQTMGSKLVELSVPRDVFYARDFQKSPNYSLLRYHAYLSADFEFHIHFETNVRQAGATQWSVYYGADQDKFYDSLRTNIYSASQRLHAISSANFSNDIVLNVPFEYIFPMIAINRVDYKNKEVASICKLLGLVLVPLTAAPSTPDSCFYKIMFRMKNVRLAGMIGSAVASAQMLGLTSIIAAKALLDNNRDRPSMTSPGIPVIPVNSSSWCYGTGQANYNNVLRLDPNCLMPYGQGRIPPIDEMKIDYIKKIFSIIKIVDWSKNDVVGKLLFSWNTMAINSMLDYPNFSHEDREVSIIPPFSYISSFNAWWRGGQVLKLNIIAATEISGSLVICYIPRVTKDFKLNITDAYTCAHSIHSIHQNREIVFKIPYVADKMFWPTGPNIGNVHSDPAPPGAVFVFVYNQLILNSTIPDTCKIVISLAADDDFEVAVPISPILGLAFNTKIFIPETVERKVVPIEGYSPSYVDSWHTNTILFSTDESASRVKYLVTKMLKVEPKDEYKFIPKRNVWYTLPTIRYGYTSDHVSLYKLLNIKEPKIIDLKLVVGPISPMDSAPFIVIAQGSQAGRYPLTCSHIMFFTDGYYWYGMPLSLGMAQKLDVLLSVKPETLTNPQTLWIALFLASRPSILDVSQNVLTTTAADWWKPNDYYCSVTYPSLEVKAEAGDERVAIDAPVVSPQQTASSSASSLVFGETFTDLKDYCRRFSLYASGSESLKSLVGDVRWRTVSIRFPVLFQGLDLDLGDPERPNEFFNRCRNGIPELVSSMYFAVTGGLVFRICVNIIPNDKKQDDMTAKVFVQHRPNITSKVRKVTIQSGVSLGTDDLELHGYASYHQFEGLNHVISVEVPYYQPTLRTYAQQPSYTDLSTQYTGLGELAIGITVNNFKNLRIDYDIYYALADDARFSVFVGTPPVFDITKIEQLVPQFSKLTEELSNMILDSPAMKQEILELPSPPEVVLSNSQILEELLKEFDTVNIQLPDYYISMVNTLILTTDEKTKVKYIKELRNMLKRYTSASGEMGLFDNLKQTVSNSAEVSEQLKVVTEALDEETISSAKKFLNNANEIFDKVKDFANSDTPFKDIGDKINKYIDIVINGITNLVHCIISFNPKTICWSFVSFFTQCKLLSTEYALKLQEVCLKLFSYFGMFQAVPNEPTPGTSASGQMAGRDMTEAEQLTCSYVSTLFAGVAAIFGYIPKLCSAQRGEWGGILLQGITKFSQCANSMYIFIRNNMILIEKIVKFCMCDHPSIADLGPLANKEESLYQWASRVLEVTDPRKENEVFTSVRKGSEVYQLAAQANVLMMNMIKFNIDSKNCRVLELLCKKICDLRERLAKAHIAPPVRFEPFVIEITGPTGIGKSELFKSLPYDIFKYAKLTHEGELVYHRNIGTQYWNNLRNQPVCIIDEKFPIKGPSFGDIQLAELMQLKSSCIFNPPMADIPDKNIRYNPMLVCYASNHAFPVLDGVLDPGAIYRRRDVLIEVSLNDAMLAKYGNKATYNELSSKDKACGGGTTPSDFSFLKFRFRNNVLNPEEKLDTWGNWIDYNSFKNTICQKFTTFFVKEEVKFNKAIKMMTSVLPGDDATREIKDILSYDWIKQFDDAYVPNAEELQVREIKRTYNLAFSESKINLEIVAKKLRIKFLEIFNPDSPDLNLLSQEVATHYRLQRDTATAQMAREDRSGRVVFTMCAHEVFGEHIMKPETTWNDVLQGWNCTVNLNQQAYGALWCGNDMDPHYQPMLLEPPEKVECFRRAATISPCISLLEDRTKFIVKDIPCGHDDCPMGNSDSYVRFVDSHWMRGNPSANGRWAGFNVSTDYIPLRYCNLKQLLRDGDYLNRLEEHRELRVSLKDKFKNWIIEYKTKISGINWKKWLKRLAIVTGILSFLGGLFGTWQFFSSGGTLTNLSSSASGIYSSIRCQGTTEGCTEIGEKDVPEDEDSEMVGKILGSIPKISTSGEGHVSGDYSTGKSMKRHTQPAVKMIEMAVGAQANFGITQETTIHNLLQRNSFFLSLYDENVSNTGRCLGICGRHALIVDHYYEAWFNENRSRGLVDLNFSTGRDTKVSVIPLKFKELQYSKISNSNLGIITLPPRFPMFKDIRKFFAPRSLHTNLNLRGEILELSLDFGKVIINKFSTSFKPYNNIKVSASKLWKDYTVHDGYTYPNFCGAGKCGSILCANGIQSPIVGIHTAGFDYSSGGIAEAVYREMFDCLGEVLDPAIAVGEGLESQWYVDSHVISYGKVPAKFAHQERGKSRIIPSATQLADTENLFKIYTQPAVLKGNDSRLEGKHFSPMREGCKHHGFPLIPFDPIDVAEAKRDYLGVVLANCTPVKAPRLLTTDEAIGGFEGIPGYEHMEFSTSEGFPLSALRPSGCHDKRWLFEFNEDNKYVKTNKILLDIMDKKWEARNSGIIPHTVFVDCLKDCTVENEKVLVPGKTRVFSMAPVDFTIHERRCTLDFVVSFMDNRRKLEHAIGINPDSIEWTWLAQDLLSKGSSIMTGDYSKYGDSLPFEFIQAAFEIIAEWYKFNGVNDEELFNQLKVFPYELGHCNHLMFDHLYQCVSGQPSGNSLTVIINSIANSLYIRCAWLKIMKNTAFCSLADMCKRLAIFSYGDDLIIALADEVKDLFNAETVQSFFAEHGLKFTNADKSGQIVPYTDLSEAEFLKRGFLPHPTRTLPQVMLAPLRVSSIEDTPNWVWAESYGRDDPQSLTFMELSLQVCTDSIRNAFGRGPEYYEYWSSKLYNFWLKQGHQLKYDPWFIMDRKIFDLEMDLAPYHKFKGVYPRKSVEK